MLYKDNNVDEKVSYSQEIITTAFVLAIIVLISVLIYFYYRIRRNHLSSFLEQSRIISNHPDITSDMDKALIKPFLPRKSQKENDTASKKTLSKDAVPNNLPVAQSPLPFQQTQKQLSAPIPRANNPSTAIKSGADSTQTFKQPSPTVQPQQILPASSVRPLSVRTSATHEILLLLPADKSTNTDPSKKSLQHSQRSNSSIKTIKVEMSQLIKMIKD